MFEKNFFSSSPWGFRFFELPDYCRTLKSLGIDQLSFMVGPEDGFPQALKGGSARAAEYKDIFAQNGVSAIECAMLLDGTDDDVRMIAGIGAKYLRICEVWEHTPESFADVTKKLRLLGKKAAEYGLTVIVENHGGLMATSADCLRLFEAVAQPNVTLNYDAANFLHYGGEDALEALKATRDIIGFTHLKNVTESGFGKGKFCRVADGVIDYTAILAELGKFYDGCLCLEYEEPADVVQGTSDDLEALKKITGK
ncbi:MAG: sugar phosphate isomerase/epimerase [Lentisphaeria bacterium]|nr:sugar phosphate isomerase/epimerase [Lentisphaeria bacterium]